MTARFQASAGSLPQCRERGSVHHPSDGERHLWSFVVTRRSQAWYGKLYNAREAFRKFGKIFCKPHTIFHPLAILPDPKCLWRALAVW
jgi:hypothetical protein